MTASYWLEPNFGNLWNLYYIVSVALCVSDTWNYLINWRQVTWTYLKLLGGKAMCFANGDKLIGITIISITSVCWASIIYFVSGQLAIPHYFNLIHFRGLICHFLLFRWMLKIHIKRNIEMKMWRVVAIFFIGYVHINSNLY